MRRVVFAAAFLLFVIPALACGSTTPTPKVQPGGGVLPSTAPAASVAPANFGKVGDTVSLKSYSVTLHAVALQVSGVFPPPSGRRYVAYNVTITAIGDGVAYNLLYGKLKLADNTEANATVGGQEPGLTSGTLAKGEAVRGWLSFLIDASAQPATLSYQILSFTSEGKVQFDVR